MVLKLKDICLNFIAKEFYSIQNFDNTLLNSTHKEKIIERLGNHDWLNYTPNSNDNINDKDQLAFKNKLYQESLVHNFFNGHFHCLKFDGCSQLNDNFLRLISEINHLKDEKTKLHFKLLLINRCHYITDDGLKCLLLNYGSDLEELTLTNLNTSLNSTLNNSIKSHKLTHVDLSYCSVINDSNIWHLCKNNPSIKSLKLTYCTQITNAGVRSALHMLNKLEVLDLEGIRDGGTSFFMDGSKVSFEMSPSINFKNMKKLCFSGSNELNNSISMRKLFKNCTQIRELNVLFSNSKSESDLVNNSVPFTEIESPLKFISTTLVSLSLYRPNIQNSAMLADCIKRMVNLEQLSLYCVECLDDDSLIKILESNGSRLTLLNLGGYVALPRKLTDESIKYIGKYCKNLQSISFDLFSSTATLESLQVLFEASSTAHKIESISLSACRNISYNLITQIVLNCVNLKKLDLSGLNQLVDENLIKLMASSLCRLETLDIKACTRATDDAVMQLALNCPLKCLVLSGISSLTDKVIFAIANHLQFSLREIYLSGCSKISNVALRYLSDCCVNRLYMEHKVPNLDPNQLMAKNLDTGDFERVDLFNFEY